MKKTLGLIATQIGVIFAALIFPIPGYAVYTLVVGISAFIAFTVAFTRNDRSRFSLLLFGTGAVLTVIGEYSSLTSNSPAAITGAVLGTIGYLVIGASLLMIGQGATARTAPPLRLAAMLDSMVVTIAFVTIVITTRLLPSVNGEVTNSQTAQWVFFLAAVLTAFPLLYLTFTTTAFTPVNVFFALETLVVFSGAVSESWAGVISTSRFGLRDALLVLFWLIATMLLARAQVQRIVPSNGKEGPSLTSPRFAILFAGLVTVPVLLLTANNEHDGQSVVYALSLIASAVVIMARIMMAMSVLTQRQSDLKRQVDIDPLTGLLTRSAFFARAQPLAADAYRDGKSVSVIFLDLSDFKTINDTLGHAAGDDLLRQVGTRLRRTLRDSDAACRLGGDEFALLALDNLDGVGGQRLADRVLRAFEAPFTLGEQSRVVHVATGIANSEQVDGDEPTIDAILTAADDAMYEAKRAGSLEWRRFKGGPLRVLPPASRPARTRPRSGSGRPSRSR